MPGLGAVATTVLGAGVDVPPVSVARLVAWWTIDPGPAIGCAVVTVLYLIGVRRLSARRRHWHGTRTAAFLTGIAMIVVATQSGLARYDDVLFSAHMAQHMLLGMVAPFFLALGAPITLALQASSRSTQSGLLRILHSQPIAVITHPLVAWTLMAVSSFVFYFSSLYELSLRHDWLHALAHLHFVLIGVLFFWPAVGLDPQPHRLSYPARLLYVLFAVPFHVFLGLAMLSSNPPLAHDFYASLHRTWGPTLMADQRAGAGIVWAIGDLFGLVPGAVIVAQWVRHDQRRQAREDQRLDAIAASAVQPLTRIARR